MPEKGNLSSQKINVDLLILNLKKKLNLSEKEIADLSTTRDITIPVDIFSSGLGMLESISLYLHDESGLSFNLIAKLLDRNYKTIWTSYNKAQKKLENANK
ncbi:MAG: hypothetical protein ABIC04_08910 [Nanoarchaeota archaeon]